MWDAEGNYYGASDQKSPLLDSSTAPKQKHLLEPDYRGFNEKRKFRDLICAVIFVAVIAGMVAISLLSFAKGDPSLLVKDQKYIDKNDLKREGASWFQQSVTDVKENGGIIIASVALAFLLGFIWVELIKRATKIIVYATIICGIIIVLSVATFSVAKGQADGSWPLTIFGIVAGIGAIVLMAVVFFLRSRINLTCAIISETCRGIQSNYFGLLSVSSFIGLFYVGFTIFWGSSFVYLYSIPEKTVTIDNEVIPKFDESVRNLMYFQIFGFFWASNFIIALFQMSVAGALSQWYFTREEHRSVFSSPAVKSLFHGLTYSVGSLAFGSLLIAIINFIQFLISQAKKGAKTKGIACVLCLIEWCFACIESLVKFINKFSYIYIAMHGYNFLKASKRCFSLLSRNFLSAAVVDYLTYYVLLIAKLLGTGISVLLTYTFLTALGREASSVTMTFVIVGSWLVFSLFSVIIDTGVDTIYVAYAEDLERNPDKTLIDPEVHQELQNQIAQAKNSVNSDE